MRAPSVGWRDAAILAAMAAAAVAASEAEMGFEIRVPAAAAPLLDAVASAGLSQRDGRSDILGIVVVGVKYSCNLSSRDNSCLDHKRELLSQRMSYVKLAVRWPSGEI